MFVRLAKWMMKLGEVHPVPPTEDFGELQEAFQHPIFREASTWARP